MSGNVETTINDRGTWRPTNFRYTTHKMSDGGPDNATSLLGGNVVTLIANGTLLLGDMVQITTTNYRVNKSTSTLNSTIGVVVGGESFGGLVGNGEMAVITNPALYGVATAATVNRRVLIQTQGIVQVVSDGTTTITAATPIAPSASTAGQVTTGVSGYTATVTPAVGTLVIAAGAVGVTSTAANGAIITGAPTATATIAGNGPLVPIIGIALNGATNVAGTVFLVLLKTL